MFYVDNLKKDIVENIIYFMNVVLLFQKDEIENF